MVAFVTATAQSTVLPLTPRTTRRCCRRWARIHATQARSWSVRRTITVYSGLAAGACLM